MPDVLTGGCACGAVRYRFEGEIAFAFNCHCRRCQRMTGSGHAAAFCVATDDIAIEGDVRHHDETSDSGFATRSGFCPQCGSPMLSRTARAPDKVFILAATLDDPSTFVPTFAVYGEYAQPWDPIDPRLKRD